jgi:hypothetical protein
MSDSTTETQNEGDRDVLATLHHNGYRLTLETFSAGEGGAEWSDDERGG